MKATSASGFSQLRAGRTDPYDMTGRKRKAGPRQMNIYAVKPGAGLAAITGQPKMGTSRDDLFPGGRCH
ncbi:MAG TPA: hypothetical protein VGL82_19590 [Bryobacteraceae bacterium]